MPKNNKLGCSYSTQLKLAKSLKELMANQPFEKLSVSDITNNCSLHRQTFYYHFEDKYELLDWIVYKELIEPLVDDITAGEAAKFIGKNTPYYLRIFSFINKFKKSRFNFSAFILSGIYFLYRKMYGLGVLFSALVLGSMVGSAYISSLPAWKSIYTGIVQAQQSGQVLSLSNSFGLSPTEFLLFLSPLLANAVSLIVMVISGLIANKCYFNHSVKKIKKIKSTTNKELLNEALETKGGVNLAIAISVAFALLVVNYLPMFFM